MLKRIKELYTKRRFYWGEVKFHAQKLRYTVRGGTVREVTKDRIDHIVTEVAFYEGDCIVGYWAFGNYDPSLPYQGQPKVKVIC